MDGQFWKELEKTEKWDQSHPSFPGLTIFLIWPKKASETKPVSKWPLVCSELKKTKKMSFISVSHLKPCQNGTQLKLNIKNEALLLKVLMFSKSQFFISTFALTSRNRQTIRIRARRLKSGSTFQTWPFFWRFGWEKASENLSQFCPRFFMPWLIRNSPSSIIIVWQTRMLTRTESLIVIEIVSTGWRHGLDWKTSTCITAFDFFQDPVDKLRRVSRHAFVVFWYFFLPQEALEPRGEWRQVLIPVKRWQKITSDAGQHRSQSTWGSQKI